MSAAITGNAAFPLFIVALVALLLGLGAKIADSVPWTRLFLFAAVFLAVFALILNPVQMLLPSLILVGLVALVYLLRARKKNKK